MNGSVSLPAGAVWSLFRLRRDGMRPLCFSGRLIARHEGWLPRVTLWHDLAIYLTATGDYAIEIVARLGAGPGVAQSRPVRCHAALFDTFDAALTQLETHDASRDICPGIAAPSPDFGDPAMSPASLAIQAALLHGFCQAVVQRYGVGVGSFLHNICMAGA
jgi:hypothetical protein